MKLIEIAVLILSTVTVSLADETNVTGKTYSFTIPSDVTFESKKGIEFYAFSWGTAPQLATLQLSGTQITLKEFKSLTESMWSTVKNTGVGGMTEAKRIPLDLGPFKGTDIHLTLKLPDGTTIDRSTLLLHDGSRCWEGRLTAFSSNDISRAYAIMMKAKSIENKAMNSDKK